MSLVLKTMPLRNKRVDVRDVHWVTYIIHVLHARCPGKSGRTSFIRAVLKSS